MFLVRSSFKCGDRYLRSAPDTINETLCAGADALAHILEASRRGPDGYPSPSYGRATPQKLGPMGGPCDAQNPRMYNRWGTPGPRDPYPRARLDGLDTLAIPPPMFNAMHYES